MFVFFLCHDVIGYVKSMRICKVLFDIIVNDDTNGYLMDILNGLGDMEEIVMDICNGIIKVDGDFTDMIDGSDIYAGDNVVCFGEYRCKWCDDGYGCKYYLNVNVGKYGRYDLFC